MKLSNVNVLRETIDELGLDLQAIADEHDQYCLKTSTEDEAMNWLHSMPIENLSDSLNREHQRPRSKYSLHDMRHKFALRKLHEKKKEELDRLKIDLNIAMIDSIISKIESVK
ncbi:hypothetical protein M0R72_01795 [Candidatus Pacearchaeota archaeon]|jgi:hypothetical protein|nr:hypothetical protein [Candidatus Pacearchaeota archaeon]